MLEFFNSFFDSNIFLVLQSSPSDLVDRLVLSEFQNLDAEMTKYIGNFIVDAKSLAAALILVYFSVKSFTLMTGDEKFDILPLLRPFALLLVILGWVQFSEGLYEPIQIMEARAASSFQDQMVDVNLKTAQRDILITRAIQNYYGEAEKIEEARRAWYERAYDAATDAIDGIINLDEVIAKQAMIIWAKIGIWVRNAMEMIIIVVFRFFFYALFYVSLLMRKLLQIIGPLSFAISIIPAFKDSYLKWISKYVSVCLYGFFGYLAAILAMAHIEAAVEKEIAIWTPLTVGDPAATGELLTNFVHNALGGAYYWVALLVGVAGFLVAPFVAHWIIGEGATGSVASKGVKGGIGAQKAAGKAAGSVGRLF